MPKIFISHAHKDKELVNKFVDTILDLGCGIPRDDIFCTSCPDKGTQEGKNFIDELKKHLEDAPLVIMMLSPNYFNSQFCLGELGATWVLNCAIFPIVIPNMKIEDIEGILQDTHMGMASDKEYLDKLHDKIVPNNPKTGTWNKQCTAFLNDLPVLLKSLEKPKTIPYSDHEKLQQELIEANKQLEQRAIEIERLLEQIARLEKAKDKEEVQEIKEEFSDESEEEKLATRH